MQQTLSNILVPQKDKRHKKVTHHAMKKKGKEIKMQDPKLRFSDRVQDYKKYRPIYPLEAVEFAKDQCKVGDNWRIADIGSGTGISTEVLLRQCQ